MSVGIYADTVTEVTRLHIRCFCGNDTMVHDGEDGQPRLYDRKWYDEETGRIRCPKCKSDALAMSLSGEAPAEGPIPVTLDPQAAFAKRRAEVAREAQEAASAAADEGAEADKAVGKESEDKSVGEQADA